MAENMFCSDHKINSEQFKKNLERVKWNRSKRVVKVFCPSCRKFWLKSELYSDNVLDCYECPKCMIPLLFKKFEGGLK